MQRISSVIGGILICGLVLGQSSDCYQSFVQSGEAAVGLSNYPLAIQYYEAARQCPDIDAAQDSIVAGKIILTNRVWRSSLSSALETARIEKENALKARDSMEVARDSALVSKQRAEAARLTATVQANRAEAGRLAILAQENVEDEAPDDAILLAMLAMATDSNSITVQRAFANAGFLKYPYTGIPASENRMYVGVHLDKTAWTVVARSKEGLDINTGGGDATTFESGRFRDVALPDNIEKPILTASGDSVIIFDHNATSLGVVPVGANITSIVYGPRDERYAVVTRENSFRLNTLELGKTTPFVGHGGMVLEVIFSYGGERLLSRSANNEVKLWGTDGKVIREIEHSDFVTSIQFSRNGKYALSASADGMVHIWDRDGNAVSVLNHDGPVSGAKFTEDEASVITTTLNGELTRWSINGRSQASYSSNGAGIVYFEKNKDERVMLVTDAHQIILCDADLKEIGKIGVFEASRNLHEAHLDPLGTYVVTSSHGDNAVKVWDTTGNERFGPPSFEDTVWDCGFSGDGKKVYACSVDGAFWVATLPDILYDEIREGLHPLPELTTEFQLRHGIDQVKNN